MSVEVGDILVGKVTGIAKFGIFVTMEDGLLGLIHISEVSSGFVKDVSKFVKVDETILVRVIGINDDKLMLSIKDINYRTKKACINPPEPKLFVDPKEFIVLEEHLSDWIEQEKE